MLEPFDFFQALANPLFHPFIGRVVVHAVAQAVGQALHVGDLLFGVVGVLIVLAVAEAFHQAGGGVAQVQRDGFGGGLLDILQNRAVGGVKRVRFGRDRKIDDGLREGEIAFGHADEIDGIARGHAQRERVRFGEADVFDRHADDAAGDVERIFSGFEHAGEPVEGGVGIAVAHGFVQRGDDVVVLFAAFVVEQNPLLEGFLDGAVGDRCGCGGRRGKPRLYR